MTRSTAFIGGLWFLVWGGMFTGIYALKPAAMSTPMGMFQGLRALLPLVAAYVVTLWALVNRPSTSNLRTPVGLLFFYAATGILTSLFLSPERITSLYWVGVYIAPILVVGLAMERPDAASELRTIIVLNYAINIIITLSLFPEAFRSGLGKISHNDFYDLFLGLGEIRSNGVGRLALVTIIIAMVRLISGKRRTRLLFAGLLLPSLFLLAQTQSRTALLGLAVSSAMLIVIRKFDWRLIFIGPAFAYLIWISGVQWRSQGQFSQVVNLTDRDVIWEQGLEKIRSSPFLGWGFHADRLLLEDAQHMHNSYLHAMIHGGIVGAGFFIAAVVMMWGFIFRRGRIRRIREAQGSEKPWLIESILIIGFLTSRSFFESTAAFYGIDLLLLVPAMAYLVVVLGAGTAAEPAAPVILESHGADRTGPSIALARGRS